MLRVVVDDESLSLTEVAVQVGDDAHQWLAAADGRWFLVEQQVIPFAGRPQPSDWQPPEQRLKAKAISRDDARSWWLDRKRFKNVTALDRDAIYGLIGHGGDWDSTLLPGWRRRERRAGH